MVLPAVVYAKVLESTLPLLTSTSLIARSVRLTSQARRAPGRERFFRHELGVWILAVGEFGEVPAIIVTVFSADHRPI